MFRVTLHQLIEITDGILLPGFRSPLMAITGGSMDSRTVRSGDIFFALKGENSHGMEFAPAAARNGAACVMTDRQPEGDYRSDLRMPELPVVVVRDTVQALRQVAAWCRNQFTANVIAITGSVGKTTTRQMIAQVLSGRFNTVQSPASFNNHLGVPLSLMLLDDDVDYAVLEIGASAIGEIAALASLAQPTMAVVTRVSPAHLAGFGNLQQIQRAKSELPAAVSSTGTVFLNGDDPLVSQMASETSARIVRFGESPHCDIRLTDMQIGSATASFRVNGDGYKLNAAGRHLVTCAAAAVATGLHAELSPDVIAAELWKFQADRGRGRILIKEPWTVIDDSYNASPASVAAAVEVLSMQQPSGRRMLVLGDMLELGDESARLHFETGVLIGHSAIDRILLLGESVADVAEGIRSVRADAVGDDIAVFSDQHQILHHIQKVLYDGDAILIKGSRGMCMEQIVSGIMKKAADQQRLADHGTEVSGPTPG